MARQINYIAMVAGISTLVLIAVSVFVPWWQITLGQPTITAITFSPVNINFAVFDQLFIIPLIFALNIACLLTLTAGGIIMLIYSVLPTKSYAKQLLGFGYKIPLYSVIFFTIEVLILYGSARYLAGMDFPLSGSGTLSIPREFSSFGISATVPVCAEFGWPFYFAIIVATLCIAARVYHRKIEKHPATQVNLVPQQTQPSSPPMP